MKSSIYKLFCVQCQSEHDYTFSDEECMHTQMTRHGAIPMIMSCPECGNRHVDQGDFATKPHHTHACQHCGMVWRPAIVPTVGVQFLPGFKDA